MATVGVAARVKERMGAGRFATGPEASVKGSVGRPARGCGEARQGYRCPRRSPGVCALEHHGGRFLGQTLSVTGRSVRDERSESYEGARGGNTGVRLEWR